MSLGQFLLGAPPPDKPPTGPAQNVGTGWQSSVYIVYVTSNFAKVPEAVISMKITIRDLQLIVILLLSAGSPIILAAASNLVHSPLSLDNYHGGKVGVALEKWPCPLNTSITHSACCYSMTQDSVMP